MSTIFDFKGMFQSHIDKNPKVWDHDRTATLWASEAFACIRKAWFDKRGEDSGYKPNADFVQSWGAAERGNIMEAHWVVPVMETENPPGTKFHFGTGEDQVTYVYGPNSATPDGLFTGCSSDALILYGIPDIESDCFMLEIKSIVPRSNLKEEKDVHHGQVQQQLGIMRSMTEYKPMYAIILYVDASFYDQITVFPVKFDETYWRSARLRAKALNAAEKPGDLRAEGILMEACTYCKWTTECAKVNQSLVPTKEQKDPFTPDEMDTLRDLVFKERAAAAAEKQAKAEKEDLRVDIKDMLSTAQTKRAGDGTFKVSWVWQKGRESLDTAAVKEAGIDLEPFKKTGNGFEKISISVSGVEED